MEKSQLTILTHIAGNSIRAKHVFSAKDSK